MQFVSLFSLFLRPRRVFSVGCYFEEVPFRGFLWIPRILTEHRSEKFEWFDPSPIEPFNLDCHPMSPVAKARLGGEVLRKEAVSDRCDPILHVVA